MALVVIEEILEGEEFSSCVSVRPQGRAYEGGQDQTGLLRRYRGLNTGGMGAYLPISHISDQMLPKA